MVSHRRPQHSNVSSSFFRPLHRYRSQHPSRGRHVSHIILPPPRASLRSPTYHHRSKQPYTSVPRISRPCTPNPPGLLFRQQVQSGHRSALPISSRDSPRFQPHLSTSASRVFSTPTAFHRASPRSCPPHLADRLTARPISAW